ARRVIGEADAKGFRMEAVYLPGDAVRNPFGELLASAAQGRGPEGFFDGYRYDVRPVTDDRPFFFYTVQPRDLLDFVRHTHKEAADYKVNRAVPLLFGLIAVSLGATSLIMLLPRFLLGQRLRKQEGPTGHGIVTFLWYFLCLGAGYILIQVALIQKFVLLLGHPTYALTVIVFSMLVASGAGSYASRFVVASRDGRLMILLASVAIVIPAGRFAAAP